MSQLRHWCGLLAAFLVVTGSAQAAGAPPDATPEARRVQRLVKLAELWGEVKFRHPGLATSDLDWDAALLAALPKVEAAGDDAAYRAAVQQMLAHLADPETRVKGPGDAVPPLARSSHPFRRWERGDTLVLHYAALAGSQAWALFQKEEAALKEDLARAKHVVVDARMRSDTSGPSERYFTWETFKVLLSFFHDAPLAIPGERQVLHSGYSGGPSSGSFYSGSLSEADRVVSPRPSPRPRRLTFLVDARTPELPTLLALRSQGRARLVAEGPVTDEVQVSTMELDLGEGVKAQVRTSELGEPLAFDATVPARRDARAPDTALARAVQLGASSPVRARSRDRAVLPPVRLRPENAYADMAYPDRAHRQLAAIRFWTVIRLFYPYLALLEAPWDGALARFLPRFEAATDAEAYARAVLEMAASIDDAHTRVSGHPALARWLPEASVALDVLELEGKVVVLGERFPGAAPGLPVGSVIESVEGEPIARRMERLAPFIPAATAVHGRFLQMRMALAGPPGSTALLGVRDAAGKLQEVKVARGASAPPGVASPPSFQLLPGGVGYASLMRLQPGEVDAMFTALKDTRALVLDLRGYPRGTFWLLAPHLNTKGARVAARFERPLVTGSAQPERHRFDQVLPPAKAQPYRGRVVVLIDERAISQAEHTGLWLEALTDVTFVGSPTAGTNGDVTSFKLPGNLTVAFSGHEVRHADGRPLQRLGLQPHVAVRPTLAGLRAGRDEVLERALQLLGAPTQARPAPP